MSILCITYITRVRDAGKARCKFRFTVSTMTFFWSFKLQAESSASLLFSSSLLNAFLFIRDLFALGFLNDSAWPRILRISAFLPYDSTFGELFLTPYFWLSLQTAGMRRGKQEHSLVQSDLRSNKEEAGYILQMCVKGLVRTGMSLWECCQVYNVRQDRSYFVFTTKQWIEDLCREKIPISPAGRICNS